MNSSHSSHKKIWWALLGSVGVVIILVILAQTQTAASILLAPIVQTAENDQATKVTILTQEIQTQNAEIATPFPTGTVWSVFPPTLTPLPDQLTPLPGTPAGAGAIYDNVPGSLSKVLGFQFWNAWAEKKGDTRINVFAGWAEDPSYGMVAVLLSSNGSELPGGGYYQTPLQAGGVRIIDAQGERLILLSESGVTFYFDIPGQMFVASLTESVPTVTPWPTYTPKATETSTY